MDNTKPLIKSLTAAAGLIMITLGAVGIVTSEADITDLIARADKIVELIAGAMVIFGRIRADSRIGSLF